ncbi:MAG: polyisoprenoid-binding protein [Sphingobacteriia bacterium]|nr:MAG: polyisoprenoid-binding protein [Sphingobacteriia bacterium]
MKKILLLLSLIPSIVFAQQYIPDSKETEIKFVVNNFGLGTNGSFQQLSGNINWDPKNLGISSFQVSIDATTIDTDNKLRDKHLRKEDYFGVQKFPTITLQSSKISGNSNGTYQLEANLTIKGTTKKISFPFTAIQQGKNIIFKGTFEINRRDYAVGGASFSLSNTVKVKINVSAVAQ